MSVRSIIIIAYLLPTAVWSQFSLRTIQEISLVRESFRVDELGYFTFFDHDMIEKYDTSNVLLFRQSLKSNGRIENIDVSNPMKPLVFFEAQQSILFLDNTLTPYQASQQLSSLGVSYGTEICYSNQPDRFWVYDQDNSRLLLFKNDGRKHLETENLMGLLDIQSPVQLLEKNNLLYLVDEFHGIFIFDMYGTFVDFIDLPEVQWIQAGENNLYFVKDKKLWSFNRKTAQFFSTDEVPVTSPYFQYSKNRFYLIQDKTIRICEIIKSKK